MKKQILFLVIMLVVAGSATAQFSISAQLRPRAEMNNGALSPISDTMSTFYYVTQRSRISLDYKTEKFRTRFSVQDVRIWGDGNVYSGTGMFASTNTINVYEAWFRIKFGSSSNLTIGRQELKYDDQRIFAWRNWNQYGLTYDALVFNHEKNGWELNIGLAYNNMMNAGNGKPEFGGDLFNSTNLMKTLNFVRLKRDFSEQVSASLYAIGSGFQKHNDPAVIYLTGTFGGRAAVNTGNFEATANVYYQMGKAQSGKKVSAYNFAIEPAYRFGKLRVGAGFDYVSGDDATASDYGEKERTFNKFYGAGFSYYGWMNYFTYLKSSTKNAGLVDIYPNLEYGFLQKHKLRGYLHFFSLANPVLIGNAVIEDQQLGQELDLMYIYKYSKELTLQAGFSYFFATDTLEQIKGFAPGTTATPYWTWVMLTYTPTLFKTD